MNFGVKSSIEEKVILAMMNKPAKPRCAGKTRAAEHSPPFRRIFEYSTSNVRLRFIKPESESLNIRQTRIQVPEVEYSICRSLYLNDVATRTTSVPNSRYRLQFGLGVRLPGWKIAHIHIYV